MRGDLLGGIWIALSSVQFGAVVVLGKTAADRGVDVIPALTVRFAIAAALLGLGLGLVGRSLRPARGEAGRLVVLGIAGYAVEAGLFFLAVQRGTATAVTLLFFVYPVIVALLAVATGRRMPRALVVGALPSAVAGAALVVASAGAIDITGSGIAAALGSATIFAAYLVAADHYVRKTAPMVGAFWVSGSACMGLALWSILSRGSLPQGTQWWPVIGMGILTAGAFFCLFAGLRLLGAVRTAIVAAMEPLSTAVLATIFLDESIRAGTVAGGALILTGAVAASLARARPEPPSEATVP